MGLRIPAYFTDDPQLLYDYIVNFKTKSGDVFMSSAIRKQVSLLKLFFISQVAQVTYRTLSNIVKAPCKEELYVVVSRVKEM